MIIKELYQPVEDLNTIQGFRNGLYKIENGLVLHFNTGLVWAKSVLVQGILNDDIQATVEEIASYNILRKYNIDEIKEMYNLDCGSDDLDIILNEYFISINGGEYYVDSLSHIEEL